MNSNLLLLILGAIFVVEGLPYFLFPDATKRFYEQIKGTDSNILRTIGLVTITIGLLIVYMVKSEVCK